MRLAVQISSLVGIFMSSHVLMATEPKEFEYPELLVSPSASERLAVEAKRENKARWSAHWAIQASALTTLMAGITSNGDPGKATSNGDEPGSKMAARAATYVGAFWLAGSAVMSATYTPYQTGLNGLKGLSNGSKKEKLAYERYAEEAIYAPSMVATVMKWASVVSNAGASGMVASNGKNSMTKFMGGVGVAGSLLPLLFEHQWNEVYRFQGDYKKRIYGPVASVNMSVIPRGDAMAALTNVGIEF